MPTVSGVEAHPFSLTSAPSDAYFEFCVRNLGDYTDAFVKKLRMVEGDRKECKLFASIEGPYGSLALPYANYRVLSFVAGGIGTGRVGFLLLALAPRRRHPPRCGF